MKKISFLITFVLGILLTGALAFADGFEGDYRCIDYPTTTLFEKEANGDYVEGEAVDYDTVIHVVNVEDGYLITDSFQDANGNNLYVDIDSVVNLSEIKIYEESYGTTSEHFVSIYDFGDYYYCEGLIEGTPEGTKLTAEELDEQNALLKITSKFHDEMLKKVKLFLADTDEKNNYVEFLPDYTFFNSTFIDDIADDEIVGPTREVSFIVVDEQKNPKWKFIYHAGCDFEKLNDYRAEKDLNSFGLAINENTITPYDDFHLLKSGHIDIGYYLPDFNGIIKGANGENIEYQLDEQGFVVFDALSSSSFTFDGAELKDTVEASNIESSKDSSEEVKISSEQELSEEKNTNNNTFFLILVVGGIVIIGMMVAIIIFAAKKNRKFQMKE